MIQSQPGSFWELAYGLPSQGGRVADAPFSHPGGVRGAEPARELDTHGTTVIAVKYRDGVLNVGDRRATAGMGVMFDRAEKVLALDDSTLIAISGSFARALEIVRYLKHAFKYYERRELQEMSLDGKVSEVSRAIANNLPMALQGIGAFIPIVSAYDRRTNEGRIFFYDGMGARFETTDFGAAGSGSERIRGAFDYIVRTRKPFREMSLEEALQECLVLLDIAADLDAATGGFAKVLPVARGVSQDGIFDVTAEQMREIVARIHPREDAGLARPIA
ncbi:MAG: proteasome subunit alpha [Armatimonadota bacterium]